MQQCHELVFPFDPFCVDGEELAGGKRGCGIQVKKEKADMAVQKKNTGLEGTDVN